MPASLLSLDWSQIAELPIEARRELLPLLEERAARDAIRQREDERRQLNENAESIRQRCKTLAGFVREAWHVLEPTNPYIHGWHVEAICEHLEAVTDGQINRLLINIPPGTMKSLLTGVFWPAWEWGPAGKPSMRIIGSSYSEDYAKRDNGRMRDLVTSEWYQSLWPITLTRSGEMAFANTATGFRQAKPFSRLTGGRGDRVIIDDPHSVAEADSDADRSKTVQLFRESVPTRVINPEKSAIIVVMQRLHENDVSGITLALKLGYEHLMLPMEFEPKRRCQTSIGFSDPRTFEGELLFPERFPPEVVARDKIPMGSYATAGQFQQRPAPRGGAVFKEEWWQYYQPEDLPPVIRIVHSWDTAFKTGQNNDFSNRTIWAECARGYYLLDRWNEKVEFPELKRQAESYVIEHHPEAVLVEDKASGQSLIQELKRDTKLPILPVKVDTDKVTRAYAATPLVESGRVFLPKGVPWLPAYLASLSSFPNGSHDDDVDSTTQALNYLSRKVDFEWYVGR